MNEVATDLDIRSLGALLRRYAVMIVVVTLLAAELGYWIASRDDPEYTASAEIEILDPSRDVVATTASSNFDLASQRETTKALVESLDVEQSTELHHKWLELFESCRQGDKIVQSRTYLLITGTRK